MSDSAQSWTLETLGTLLAVLAGLWAFLKWPMRGARNTLVLDTLRECRTEVADAVIGALRHESAKYKASIEAQFPDAIAERQQHAKEIAAVRGQVDSVQRAIDGRFDNFSKSVDKLAVTLDNVVERLSEQGENIAHMRGRFDHWDGQERRREDRRRRSGDE